MFRKVGETCFARLAKCLGVSPTEQELICLKNA